MKHYVLALSLVLSSLFSKAQTYNNEWINYNNTYYKFNVGANGLYRIPQSALAAVGLSGTSAEYFQLWRNGVEVPMFTSVASGALGSSDYLEFYGQMNDGTTDTKLYKTDLEQMSSKISLYTDTAAYFLTVNTTSLNKRYSVGVSDVANNTLGAEPYFNYVLGKYYKNGMNVGKGIYVGELVSSASYETSEGWTSNGIGTGGKLSEAYNALKVYTSGPTATLSVVMAGNNNASHRAIVKLRTDTVIRSTFSSYNISRVTSSPIPLTDLANDSAKIEFTNLTTTAGDAIVVSQFELTYPRVFNFGGASQFNFDLAASDTGKYLAISGFTAGTGIPLLYDLTNNIRYTAVVASGLVKFALPASASTRSFVLLSTDASKISSVGNITTRNFINYQTVSNQGDYVIISHPLLYDDGSGNNNVEKYRAYRSSPEGGGYNGIIVNMDQLTDQFGFGVKHHPLAIRNFSAFALANFSVKPKYFFLIGKGLNYNAFRSHESSSAVNKLAMIPTFGYPSSDNLLTASRTGEYPLIPIGRLSAIAGSEVGIYLNKIKEYESVQKTASQTINDRAWMKNIAEVTGGLTDASLSGLITSFMQGYQETAEDTVFGAKVYQFSANSGSNKALGTTKTMDTLFSEGLSLITYFGHSSPNTIEFNLDAPQSYNNAGKYPLIMINGCESGDLFQFDTARAFSSGTLSERFVFADRKGSICYIASTHFGLPTQLNYVNTEFYNNFCNNMYGQSLGNILKTTMTNVFNTYGSDYIVQTHVEEITLHGDPAITINSQAKPDYAITDSLLNHDPLVVSVADDKVNITANIFNIGKTNSDSIPILVQHVLPNNTTEIIYQGKIKSINYQDSITVSLPLNPLEDKGTNQIIFTIDPDNLIPELSETNNTATKSFTIIEDEIRPVYPYNYAIINDSTPVLFASTANSAQGIQQYVMEMDTTALFNSAFKVTQTVSGVGGVIQFSQNKILKDSVVYYWRVAIGPVNADSRWLSSSFIYIKGTDDGFNQSHFYQYKNNDYTNIHLDSSSRKFIYDDKLSKLLTRTGIIDYYDWDQNNVNIDDIQVDFWGCGVPVLQFYVFDSVNLAHWKNSTQPNGKGSFGSNAVCADVRAFFEFSMDQKASRKAAMDFLDSIPKGDFVLIRNINQKSNSNVFIDAWKSDTATYGSGKSLWHKFHELGLNQIDSFTQPLAITFVFKKGDSVNFPIYQSIGKIASEQLVNIYYLPNKQTSGDISSPWMGPALAWKRFKWDEYADTASTIQKSFDILGQDASGQEVLLTTVNDTKDNDISFISAAIYPYLKMRLHNEDVQQAKITQLKYWMLTASTVPEGAIDQTVAYQFKDTVSTDDTLHFKVGFKNISSASFDSIKVRLTITDMNGVAHIYNNLSAGNRIKPLVQGDSVIVSYDIPLAGYFGNNQFYLDINPDKSQPEQFHFNNVLFRSLFVTFPAACPDAVTSFYTGQYSSLNTYKWQVNTGSGYTDLANDATYSGVDRDTLIINNASTSMYGYKYRTIINKNSVLSNSNEYTLKFAETWTGAVDDAWEKAGNWSCNTVPDVNTDVIIHSDVPNNPVIRVIAECRSITAKPNASLQVNTEGTLNIAGPSSPQ